MTGHVTWLLPSLRGKKWALPSNNTVFISVRQVKFHWFVTFSFDGFGGLRNKNLNLWFTRWWNNNNYKNNRSSVYSSVVQNNIMHWSIISGIVTISDASERVHPPGPYHHIQSVQPTDRLVIWKEHCRLMFTIKSQSCLFQNHK